MASLSVRVPRDINWTPAHRVRLRVGSENAASLAASTPAGGTLLTEARPWQEIAPAGWLIDPLGAAPLGYPAEGLGLGQGDLFYGALGLSEAPRVLLQATVRPVDKLCRLPVGVDVIDEAGNVSAVVEQLIELSDLPRGVRRVTIEPGPSAGQAIVRWTRSADVV